MRNLLSRAMRDLPSPTSGTLRGIVPYGACKADGSHDHRTNRAGDRTPAQKAGDAKRSRRRK